VEGGAWSPGNVSGSLELAVEKPEWVRVKLGKHR